MSLPNLPNELILHLYKSFDKVNEAAALSHTSRHFHTIWRYNLTSICDAVLPKVIRCYSQHCQLAEARANSDLVVNQSSDDDGAKAAVVRAQAMLNDDTLAGYALGIFENQTYFYLRIMGIAEQLYQCDCTPYTRNRREYILAQFTCNRFSKGLLRAMSILYLAGKSGTKIYKFLASMNLVDFYAMVDVMEWYVYNYEELADTCKEILVPADDSRSWRPATEFPKGFWEGRMDGFRFLEVVRTELVKVSGIKPPSNDGFQSGLGTRVTSYQLILHKDCEIYNTDAAESLALADLLPLLPESCSVGPDYELSLPHKSEQLSNTVAGGKERGSCDGKP